MKKYQTSSETGPRIAICSPGTDIISETFIKAHQQLLNGVVHFLSDGLVPIRANGTFIIKRTPLIQRARQFFPQFYYSRYLSKGQNASLFRYYLQKENIDVVLAEYGTTGAAVFPICQKAGIPLIVHFHGYDASMHETIRQHAEVYPAMFSYASAIVSVSTAMTKRLEAMGCPGEKIVYNPYGPADDFFDIKPAIKSGYFLSVGRFVEKKAPHLTILAFKKLQEKRPDAKLVMVGSGPLLGACQWLAESIGVDIQFEGDIRHDQLRSYFESACCFVQHSVTAKNGDREGTPVGIIEACAASLPVISTRHEGIMDLIEENNTGLLVDEGDIEAMSEAMLKMYDNETLREQMGMAGRLRVKEHFSMEKHINTLDHLIAEAVNLSSDIPQ